LWCQIPDQLDKGTGITGKKFHKVCRENNDWLRQTRNAMRIQDWWPLLAAKVRGHYNYYGVSGNSRMMANFGYVTRRTAMKWLNRRSQRKSFVWKQRNDYLTRYPLPKPHIVHNLYQPSPRK
jgi:RNA-directed DNA polymerase